MKRAVRVLLVVALCVLSATAFAQQITSQDIGAFTGKLTVTFPPSPCSPSDTVTFSGSINAVTQVDTTQNTVDIHLALQSVKGTGNFGTYVANGTADFLSQPLNSAITVSFAANLFPPSPCRSGFTSQGALPVNVTLTLDQNNVLTGVSTGAGCTTDVCNVVP